MSRLEAYLLDVIRGRRGVGPAALRTLLGACSATYGAGLEAYLLTYRVGLRKRTALPCTVVSVGNLTVGGTGKTPITEVVCRRLGAMGLRCAILSRGYRGAHENGARIASDGAGVILPAAEAGDEACLLAHSLPGVPVLVGKDRRATGRLAVRRFAPDVLVLDDGMQYWQLHRDLDIVLLDAETPFDNGRLLPRGLLREPPSHLRRAGLVVMSRADAAGADRVNDARRRVRALAPGVPICTSALSPTGLWDLSDHHRMDVGWLRNRKVAAVCGIAQPASFVRTLADLGAQIIVERFLSDHAGLDAAGWREIEGAAFRASADAIVMTSKDGVKAQCEYARLPVLALSVEARLDDVDKLMTVLNAAVHAHAGCPE